MEKKSINDIISDWKTHSLPVKGYPNHSDRALYLMQLFEEIARYGFTRSEASSQSVLNKILDRLIAKTAKADIKKSLISQITEQVERSISTVYGSFAVPVANNRESVSFPIQEKIEIPLTSTKNEDIVIETPTVRPAKKEKVVKYLSEEKRAELLKQFKFRVGHDEDLD